MKYIPGLPNNPPTHLVEYFHNKALVEDVRKQLNFIIGSLLNSLQNKAATLQPVSLFMNQMVNENFNGQITLDYISKGIDFANYCVATKDLNNIRQGWPKISDDLSVGMSAAFVLNNESMLSQIPQALHPMIQNSAMAMSTEITAATNFSNNGSINMYQQFQQPQQMMPQQGVQQFPANGVQQFMQQPMQMMPQQFGFQQPMQMQQPQITQQQIMMMLQQNPQLAMMYQQNPQAAMQMIMQQMQAQQMQNPYMQRANTVTPMQQPMQQMMPQAPVNGFINNNPAYGNVPQQQVGTARGSSFSRAPANVPPQQVQLNVQPQNNPGMINPNQQPQQQFQPQPTAQQPAVHQQVVSANIVHGGSNNPVNMTQQTQPIQNANTLPQHGFVQPITTSDYSNLANDPSVVSDVRAVATGDMSYDVAGRRIGRMYSRDHEIVKVTQDNNGVVVEDTIEEATVKYEEHESQRILPSRTKAEKRAAGSSKRMNEVLEMASNEVSYQQVLEKIRKDQTEAGEELVDVDVTRIITELGTNALRLDIPTYSLDKTSILPILSAVLDKNKIPVDTSTRSVINDVVVGGPLVIGEELAGQIDKLNKTANLNAYISQLEYISGLDIPNFQWSWIHDEVLKEINSFLEKYFGLSITIDSVLLDLDELIDYVSENYGNELSSQMYIAIHNMLKSTVLQVLRHDEWPDIIDEGQIFIAKIYRVITLPIVSCQVPYNVPGKSGIIDRNTHTQLVKLLDNMMKWREDYHSMLLITVDNDIIEVNTTTIDGNYIMYCGND